MSRPLLPPRGLFTGTRLLFDRDLSPNIKETLLQLMSLTWGNESHITPPLSYPLLEHLTGKDSRTLRGHLSALRSYHAALRLQRAGTGEFFVLLAGWLFRNDVPVLDGVNGECGRTSPQPVKDDEPLLHDDEEQLNQIVSIPEESFLPPEIDHDQGEDLDPLADVEAGEKRQGCSTGAARGARQLKRPDPPLPALDPDLEEKLRDAGVFPVLLVEVARRAHEGEYSAGDLEALLDWCAEDQPGRAAALFVGRLRAGARAPAVFSMPACPRCGRRGGHAQECSRRYALDDD